jgi:DNA-binding NtrC family response regulator
MEKAMIHVLMIDDEVKQAVALKRKLATRDIVVTLVSSALDIVALLKGAKFDVALLDTRLSGMHGLGLFEKLKRNDRTLPIILYTDCKNADSAARCMKRGAYDCLIKPCNVDTLIEVIRKAAKRGVNHGELTLHGHSERNSEASILFGQSEEIKKVRELIGLVAPSQAPVLILGETGTGKELAARAIHTQSLRRGTPLVVINAGALQENILESELFGYKKGAFTGAVSDKKGLLEVAHNGTCFIDEIGDMGLSIQTKILRVVESGVFMKLGDTHETKVDVRFVFATNQDLTSSIQYGSFRKDLFYRINAITLTLPSLKERGGDITLLANHFLTKFSREKKYLSKRVIKLLTAYNWPGNVRELANVIQRAVLFSGSRETITWEDIPEDILHAAMAKTKQKHSRSPRAMSLHATQGEHVAKIMDLTEGNKAQAARLLGISRNTLYRKLVLQSA